MRRMHEYPREVNVILFKPPGRNTPDRSIAKAEVPLTPPALMQQPRALCVFFTLQRVN